MADFGAGVDGDVNVYVHVTTTKWTGSDRCSRHRAEGLLQQDWIEGAEGDVERVVECHKSNGWQVARTKDWLLGFESVMSGVQHVSTVPALIFRVHRNARLPACQKVRLCDQESNFPNGIKHQNLQSGSDQIGIEGSPQHKIVRPSFRSGCR